MFPFCPLSFFKSISLSCALHAFHVFQTCLIILLFYRGIYFYMYFIQHCIICRPSDCTVSEDAGIEHRTAAATVLQHWQSDALTTRLDHIHYSAKSHPHSARSHPHWVRLDLIHIRLDLINRIDLIHPSYSNADYPVSFILPFYVASFAFAFPLPPALSYSFHFILSFFLLPHLPLLPPPTLYSILSEL